MVEEKRRVLHGQLFFLSSIHRLDWLEAQGEVYCGLSFKKPVNVMLFLEVRGGNNITFTGFFWVSLSSFIVQRRNKPSGAFCFRSTSLSVPKVKREGN